MMSDAWEEIQQIKSKRNILRERLEKRRKERQDILGSSLNQTSSPVESPHAGIGGSGDESRSKQDESESDPVKTDPELEKELLKALSAVTLQIPTTSTELIGSLTLRNASHKEVCNLLNKFSIQKLITTKSLTKDCKQSLEVTFIDVTKVNAMLVEMLPEIFNEEAKESVKRKRDDIFDKAADEERKKRDKKEPKADIMASLMPIIIIIIT